jgi:hypothetical protein
LLLVFSILGVGCTTTTITTTDAKGSIVTTRTISPAPGIVQAIGIAVGETLTAILETQQP